MLNSLSTFAVILEIIAIAVGLGLVVGGFFRLKLYGQMRGNFMSYQMTLSGPLMMFLAGVLLLVLPTTLRSGLLAFWGSSSPMAYTGNTTNSWAAYVPVVIRFVQVVGIAAFIRGIMLISKAGGGQQSQPGARSKALLHMLGGVLCINVVATHALLASFLPI